MSTLLEYKCPKCGGAIEFDSSTQNMKCPYCDSEFDVETMKAFDEALNVAPDSMEWNQNSENQWRQDELTGMSVYSCQSCGGEIICDQTTAASTCPYCDNPIVMKGNFVGDLRPDLVIPFKLDKKAAKESLINHLKGKILLPKVFKDENHIDEIKGVYVPFWLFDCNTNSTVHFNGTKVRHWTSGDYRYTETRHFLLTRGGTVGFNHIPVDGSEKMADDLMESIEPYNIGEAVDFQTAYLAGYMADKYDVSSEQCFARANQRVKSSVEDTFKGFTQEYNAVSVRSSNVNLTDNSVKYALYPVWLLNTTWNNQKFTFAMNGQTGKFVGNLPMDKGLFWKWFFLIFAIVAVISAAIGFFLMF